MSRQPRQRGGAPSSTPAAAAPSVVAPEEIPLNKRDVTFAALPSAQTRLAEGPIELGIPNPMRLHVKGNIRGIVYSASNEKRLAMGLLKRGAVAAKASAAAAAGVAATPAGKEGVDHLAEGATSAAIAAPVSVKAAVAAAKRPNQKRPREL